MKKNYRYLLNGILIAMVIAGLLQYFQAPASPSGLLAAETGAEAKAFSSRIVTLKTEDLAARLQERGKRKLLFIYTSWCPYCKRQMPIIEELIAGNKHLDLAVIPLSTDQNKTALAEYLSQRNLPAGFTPYHAPDPRATAQALKPLGGHFQGSIPYLAVFDGQGKLTREFMGLSSKEALEAALAHP